MRNTLLVVLLLASLAAHLAAQDTVFIYTPDAPQADSVDTGGIPADLVQDMLERFNDSSTTRLWGDVDLTPGARLAGTVGVFRGSVAVSGTIDGDLLVINGSVTVRAGGRVSGDVMVVGGRLTVQPGAVVMGTPKVFWEAAPVVRAPDGTLVLRSRRSLPDLSGATATFRTGSVRTTLVIGTDRTYNRVEGLPIVFGPTFELLAAPATTLRFDLRGILRTAYDEAGLRDDFGWRGRLEFRQGDSRPVGIGLRGYSQVVPIQEHPLALSENGWSAFLLQRDYRDWYQAQGVGANVYGYPSPALRVEARVRYDRETSVRANDPWSLFRNTDRWRTNPLIDDGHYLTATVGAELDTRNSTDLPTAGWWLRADFERSWSDDVAPVTLPPEVRDGLPTGGNYVFNVATIDLRRYNRLSTTTRVNARLFARGHAGGDPLPVQRRVGLGGPDPMPGFRFRSTTCAPSRGNDPAFSALCDRVMVAQVEVRRRLSLDLGYHYHDSEWRSLDRFIGIDEADLVFFADAGKAWLSGDGPGRVPDNRVPNFDEWDADVGVGIDAGGIGAYLAKALTGDEPVRIILRLQRRF